MCAHVRVHKFTYLHVCVYKSLRCVHILVCVHVCWIGLCVCRYYSMHVHMFIRGLPCVHVCTRVLICVRASVYICVYVYTRKIFMWRFANTHNASSMCMIVWEGGGRREEKVCHKNCSDVDGTSTKYEAHQSTLWYHACSLAHQRRKEMHPKFESDHLYGGEYFLLFSWKFLTIAFLVCTMMVALRVMNTDTYSERMLTSQRAFSVAGDIWNWFIPTQDLAQCISH